MTDDPKSRVRPRPLERCGHVLPGLGNRSAVELRPLERRPGAQRWGMVCALCGKVTDAEWFAAPMASDQSCLH